MSRSTLPTHYHQKEHTLDVFLSRRFSEELRELPDKSKRCLDPMLCDTDILDVLAKKLTTDFWSDALEEDEKRILLQKTIALKRTKGTIYGLKQVFSSLGIDVDVDEWFDYEGDPFHFMLTVNIASKEITPVLIDTLLKMIREYKNTRSSLDELLSAYLQKQHTGIALGSVGEVTVVTEMLDGYTATPAGVQLIYSAGVCEATAYTQMEVL